MNQWLLILTIGAIIEATVAFIWLALKLDKAKPQRLNAKGLAETYEDAADREVEHIFNAEFREELRNRGRLHFEKIISENAMFLQQDLRLTTSQLNEYMKTEISNKLAEEFATYEQSIADAKELALNSITQTQTAIEQQRQALGQQLEKEVLEEKQRRLELFDKNMAEVVNHYVLAAIGDQIDLNDQLEYIIGQMEANKQAIMEDIKSGG